MNNQLVCPPLGMVEWVERDSKCVLKMKVFESMHKPFTRRKCWGLIRKSFRKYLRPPEFLSRSRHGHFFLFYSFSTETMMASDGEKSDGNVLEIPRGKKKNSKRIEISNLWFHFKNVSFYLLDRGAANTTLNAFQLSKDRAFWKVCDKVLKKKTPAGFLTYDCIRFTGQISNQEE